MAAARRQLVLLTLYKTANHFKNKNWCHVTLNEFIIKQFMRIFCFIYMYPPTQANSAWPSLRM